MEGNGTGSCHSWDVGASSSYAANREVAVWSRVRQGPCRPAGSHPPLPRRDVQPVETAPRQTPRFPPGIPLI